MKILNKLILPLATCFILTSCGPNLGNEVGEKDFNTKVLTAIATKVPECSAIKINGSVREYGYDLEGNYYDKTTQFNSDSSDEMEQGTAIAWAATLSLKIFGTTIIAKFKGNIGTQYFYNENDKNIGLKVNNRENYDGGESTAKGTLQWDQYGSILFADFKEEDKITGTKQDLKPIGSVTKIIATYTYKTSAN